MGFQRGQEFECAVLKLRLVHCIPEQFSIGLVGFIDSDTIIT